MVAVEEATDSLGFVVERHGWTFANYAASGSTLFGVADAVALFGDSAVCVEAQGECTPIPAAAEWIDMVATSMQYGVCEGMTVASVDRFLVGADPVTGLLALDHDVERQLARLFATQFLGDVIEATEQWRKQSVADIVAELQVVLADPSAEQYTLGVYSPMGGHSVLPYAVDVDGSGRGVVYVYDPNWPDEQRYVEVDTTANSWRFSYFSPEQSDDPEAWTGGNGMMDLTPLSVREAPFPEPFKGSGTGVKQLLAISSSSRNWTLILGDGSHVDGQSVMPGRDGVLAVTRGAPLDNGGDHADAVLVEWTNSARLEVQSGAATLSLFTDAGAGSVAVSDEASINVEVPDDVERVDEVGLVIEVETAEDTEAVVTMASTIDRVRVEVDSEVTTTVRLTEESTDVEVVDKSGDQLMAVEVPRSKIRIDVAVDVNGDIEVFEPETISAEERIEAVEKSSKLLVADDLDARTVEVTSASVDNIDEKRPRVASAVETEKTFTTTTVLEATTTVLEKVATERSTVDIGGGTGCVRAVAPQSSNRTEEWSLSSLRRLYQYSIELFAEDPKVDMNDLLTEPAWLGIRERAESGSGTVLLKIHGVLSSVEQLDPQSYGVHYRCTLVPRLWQRSLEQQSQVHRGKTIPQIIEEELKNGEELPIGLETVRSLAGCIEEWVYDETQKTDEVILELKIWGHPDHTRTFRDAPAMRCVMVPTAAPSTEAATTTTLRKKKR